MTTVTAAIHTTPDSCWTKMRNCLCGQGSIQSMKAALWLIGAGGSAFLPVPSYVKGALCFSSTFMAGHAIAQHPNSTCMQGDTRRIALSRTWKHITAGVAVSGIGGGLGNFLMSSDDHTIRTVGVVVIVFSLFGGMATTYYSDGLIRQNYAPLEINPPADLEQPLVAATSTSGA